MHAGKLKGVAEVLQSLHASAGSATSQPLLLGFVVPFLLERIPLIGPVSVPQPSMNQWIDNAQRVELAHRVTIAWIRSKLPRYPIILAPQITLGSPRTVDELGGHLIWRREDLQAGYQFDAAPPRLSDLLGLDREQSRLLSRRSNDLVTALRESPEWGQFAEADGDLSRADKEQLRAARELVKGKVSPSAVDTHDESDVWARMKYRNAEVSAGINALTGNALRYARAFSDVDRLIELAAGDVFAQRVAFGVPREVEARGLTFNGSGEFEGTVAFTTDDDHILTVTTGSLVWIDDPLIDDALRVEAESLHYENTGATTLEIRARILVGTGDAWTRAMLGSDETG